MKEIIVMDKWQNLYNYPFVYKHKVKKNKLYIYTSHYKEKAMHVFILTYIARYFVINK